MRWSYLIPRIVIVAVVWAFFAFGFDPLVRTGLIATGQQAAHARVNVDGLTTTLFPPKLNVGRLQVANRREPGTNLFEFASLNGELRGQPLLLKRFVIDDGRIDGVKFGTARSDSGLLPEEPVEDEDDSEGFPYGEYADQFKQRGQQWLDEMLQQAKLEFDPQQLETVRVGDEVHQQWKARFDALELQGRELESGAKQIREMVESARDADTIRQIDQYARAAEDARRLLNEAKALRAKLAELAPRVRTDYARLDQARRNDQQMIRQKVDTFIPDGDSIAESLLGPELAARVEQAMEWVQTFKKYAAAARQDVEPERSRGIDFTFPRDEELPAFLVRNLQITGETQFFDELMPFKSSVTGITSDPVLYGQPVEIDLSAQGTQQLIAKATFDLTDDTPEHEIRFAYRSPRQSTDRFGDGDRFALLVSSAQTDWTGSLRFVGDRMHGAVRLSHGSVRMEPTGSRLDRPEIQRAVSGLFASINTLDATITLDGTVRRPKLKMSTNLGPQIAAGFRSWVSSEIDVQQQRLAQLADTAAEKHIAKLKQRLAGRYQEISAKQQELMAKLDLEELGLAGVVPGQTAPADIIKRVSRSRKVQEKIDKYDPLKKLRESTELKKLDQMRIFR